MTQIKNLPPLEDLVIPHMVFSDEFVQQEIKWFGLQEGDVYDCEGVKVVVYEITGRCDDYLNKNYRVGGMHVPILQLDGRTWMSLTPMEVQSNYLGWHLAMGVVGIAGLGLGYAALKAAEKEEVESVTVFENDQRVIDMFRRLHGERHAEAMEKITIVKDDARRVMYDRGKLFSYEFDFFYSDIYLGMCDDEMLEDVRNVNPGLAEDIRFWGQEKVMLTGLGEYFEFEELTMAEQMFLRRWRLTEEHKMYDPVYDADYVQEFCEALMELRHQMSV